MAYGAFGHCPILTSVDISLLYLQPAKYYNVLATVALLATGYMLKSNKPDFLPEERLLACLMFLSQLRKRGVTNMFEIRLKLRHAFPDLTTDQAAEVIAYWMRTFAAA